MVQTFESWYASTLSQKFSSTDTVMYVATPPTVTSGRMYLTDGSQKERVSFSGVSGSTLTWCVRNLSKTADPTTAWVGLNRLAGNPIVLVAMHDQIRDKSAPTDPLIYGRTYATIAARDAALWGDGAAIHPYTSIYVTDTWLHYNYNTTSGVWESVDTGTATPNANTTTPWKVQKATLAEVQAKTDLGSSWASLFASPADIGALNMTAWENLTAGNFVCQCWSTAIKSIRRRIGKKDSWATGLDSSTTQRMLVSLNIGSWKIVTLYKKSADNKIYWTVNTSADATISVPVFGTELKISDDALEADDGFSACNIFEYVENDKFFVTYKKASDDKVYWVVCTVSGTDITAGSATKIYDTNILQANTRPTCCIVSWGNDVTCRVAVGFHDDVTDNPTIIPCLLDISARSITPETPIVAEAVTMNDAGMVYVVALNDLNGTIGVFYDNGTNIRFNTITTNATVAWTTIATLIAWTCTGSCRALWYGQSQAILFIPAAWFVRALTVNSDRWDWKVNYFDSTQNNVIYTGTSSLIAWDVGYAASTTVSSSAYNGDLLFASTLDWYWYTRIRLLWPWTNGFCIKWEWRAAEWAADPVWVAVCRFDSIAWQPRYQVATIRATAALDMNIYRNNEQYYIWVVKTTTTAGNSAPIILPWQIATVPSVIAWLPLFLWDAGQKTNNYWTKLVWVGIATNTVLLQ